MASRVSQVVLHRHGMGYFERRARVEGRGRETLWVRQEAMDDVLKSLQVEDAGGGRLLGVTFEGHPALEEGEPEGVLVAGLVLRQLVGAAVRLELSGEAAPLEARVVGIEGDEVAVWGAGGLQRLAAGAVRTIVPLDEGLRREVEGALERAVGQRRPRRRRLVLDLDGVGEREVRVRYMMAVPVWRASYRVVVQRSGGVELWGYAVVDNDTEEDWEDVTLVLMSGAPVSFQHELYAPRRRDRPAAGQESTNGTGAVIEGSTFEAVEPRKDGTDGAAGRRMRRGSERPTGWRSERSMTFVVDLAEEEAAVEALRHEVGGPVRVPRGQSALVPLWRHGLSGELVALYNAALRSGRPLLAVRLRNDVGVTLVDGPATVTLDGDYAGEGMVEGLRPGRELFVPFAAAVGCEVSVVFGSSKDGEHTVTMGRGFLFHTTWTESATTYRVHGAPAGVARLYIDHPAEGNAEYLGGVSPVGRWGGCDRFMVPVQEGEGELVLSQRRRQTETLWVTPEHVHEHLALARRASTEGVLLAGLTRLVEIGEVIAHNRIERAQCDDEIARLSKQGARARKNLEALGEARSEREQELRARCLQALDDDEARLRDVQRQRQEFDRQVQHHKRLFRDEAVRLLGENASSPAPA